MAGKLTALRKPLCCLGLCQTFRTALEDKHG